MFQLRRASSVSQFGARATSELWKKKRPCFNTALKLAVFTAIHDFQMCHLHHRFPRSTQCEECVAGRSFLANTMAAFHFSQ